MMRALLGWVLCNLAYQLARAAEALTRPQQPTVLKAPAPLIPPPTTLVPPAFDTRRIPERYVRELVRIDLVRADSVLAVVLGNGPLYFNGTSFMKIGDPRWRQ